MMRIYFCLQPGRIILHTYLIVETYRHLLVLLSLIEILINDMVYQLMEISLELEHKMGQFILMS